MATFSKLQVTEKLILPESVNRRKMAKYVALPSNLALVVYLLLLISIAEGRLLASIPSTPSCEAVHGVRDGDTCFAIQQEFTLTLAEFEAINPNLVCEKLFLGQWICIAGTA